MTVVRICAAVLCLVCLAAPDRGGFAAAVGENNGDNAMPILLVENRTGIFTLLGICFSNRGNTVEDKGLHVDFMEAGAIRNPQMATADIDIYCGMNEVHFLFAGIPVRQADRLIVGFTQNSTPTLEAFANDKSIYTATGRLTLESME